MHERDAGASHQAADEAPSCCHAARACQDVDRRHRTLSVADAQSGAKISVVKRVSRLVGKSLEPPAARGEEQLRPRLHRLELVDCGKGGEGGRCRKCASRPGHGPYWYRDRREDDKMHKRYVGKNLILLALRGDPSQGSFDAI